MHGFSSGSALVVNAEVDSMGGVVEGGEGIACDRTSPRRAVIEKVQAELRQEYDVREERRRELEYLEKGGDPLDFKYSIAASLSVQSTSVTDQQPNQFVTSEAKGSFARTASPHGDSVESCGRPGASPFCEPNSADNLMLFDGENEFSEVDKNLAHPAKTRYAASEQSSQLDGKAYAKELKDSVTFSLPRQAYRRRSRPNRDGARTSSNDAILARSGHGTSLSSHHAPREVKGLLSNASMNFNSTPSSPIGDTACKSSDGPLELDGVKAAESTADFAHRLSEGASDANASNENHPSGLSAQESPEKVRDGHECSRGKQDLGSADLECQPCLSAPKIEDHVSCGQINGFSGQMEEQKDLQVNAQNCIATASTKPLDSESSCTHTARNVDGFNDDEMRIVQKSVDSNGNVKRQMLVPEENLVKEATEFPEEKKSAESAVLNEENNFAHQIRQDNGFASGPEEEMKRNSLDMENDVKDQRVVESLPINGTADSETERKFHPSITDILVTQSETAPIITNNGSANASIEELPEPILPVEDSTATMEGKESNLKSVSKADEDAILEEARIIEAKRKRISELSVATSSMENHQRSHWDYVLEEMAWLANDFAQERLWKMTASAQVCHQVARTTRLRFQEKHSNREQKKVAHLLSNAVREFWSSVQKTGPGTELTCQKDSALSIREYALRFLKYNSSNILYNQAEAPATPDRNIDSGIMDMDMSWEDHWTEENLFYSVPCGAMEAYRKIIESHVVHYEKAGISLLEEVETSACDAVTDFGSQENAYEEEEGETSTHDCDISKRSRFAQKKQKISTKGYGVRLYEVGANSMYTQCMDSKLGTQQSVSIVRKHPASSLNVSIPTKRVRTASRQRITSPFTAGTSGCVPFPSKTDASSGDTSSFQDDQSTPNGKLVMPNSLEVESVGGFEKRLPFDCTEVSKPKKKKKAKHMVSAYEQRWQVDSNFHNEQRDHSKKRSESHQLESNGSSGLYGQHILKKPKVMRPPALDNSYDNIAPVAGSIPSPVASQMSNMPNPNKLMKILGGRDRGRKAKASKVPTGQLGSGSPWSLFEDQALVVLVHDMGPNWELVSDAINSTLQFKCVYRKPKECKERHKILMDRTTGDGADSAEDSGSSQPYPSTLPGIPKGSARQLFQRLQGPMEEDTLKSHFEKIIMIAQKQHYRKTQNDSHDPKQLQQPHSSHMLALSQIGPNNLNRESILTPLELCDPATSCSDPLSLGYQSPHNNGLAMSNQGPVAPMQPAPGINPALQGSSNTALGNNFSLSSGSLNPSVRDARYAVPRSASLSIDEQQRMQQYNHMFPARNIQQPALAAPGGLPGSDRGVRMLPGGNGIGAMAGANRNVSVARPGFHAMASSSMLNSGSMLSSGVVAMSSPVNMHSGPGSGQGSSVMRSRDALHMMRPSQNQETQRQILAPELQMQVSQANNQGAPPYGGLSPSFPNQAGSSPSPSYALHHQQSHPVSSQQPHMLTHHPHLQGANHASNPQHQAYAVRLAKERHLQQRYLQQQQQYASPNALLPHVQSQGQLPISSPSPSSSQVQSQTSSPPVSFTPLSSSSTVPSMPQHQQKHQIPQHGLVRNSQTGGSGLTNQGGKQRRQPQQQQQTQQSGRHHPQQRLQPQSQQQTKHVKGVGKGNTVIQQSTSVDSLPNGLPVTPENLSAERREQAMHLAQGQGFYSGSALNPSQNAKQSVSLSPSNQSLPQQQVHPGQGALTYKHVQQISSHSNHTSQSNVAPIAPACLQAASPLYAPSSNQQMEQHSQLQVQSHQKSVNQNPPTSQIVPQLNCQVNSEMTNKLQSGESQSEQRHTSNRSHPGITEPHESSDAPNGIPVVSSGTTRWIPSEPLYDSVASTPPSTLDSTGTQLTYAAGEPTDALGPKQSSSILTPSGPEANAQWQQSLQLQQSPSPASQPQHPQQHPPPAQHPQQQGSHVQAGNNSLCVTPDDSRVD